MNDDKGVLFVLLSHNNGWATFDEIWLVTE